MHNELFYQIALTQVKGIGILTARHLLDTIGSASGVFKESPGRLLSIAKIGQKTVVELKAPEPLRKAEEEMKFIEKNNIQTYFINDPNYPSRLKECCDAPMLLYFKGKSSLESHKTVSIVGTRKASAHGLEQTTRLIEGLQAQFSDILIISGLAYGIDIAAHRAAVQCSASTIGVLAHGLDRIYPHSHRKSAIDMLDKGGLLTEFVSGTEPERYNFVARNRIIAGLSDVTVVIESSEKGGSLITANVALGYNRSVCAFAGRASDVSSRGCNNLIKTDRAALIDGVDDLILRMGWGSTKRSTPQPKQLILPLDLTEEEVLIVNCMKPQENYYIGNLFEMTAIPIYQLSSILTELEMKGLIKPLPGSSYTLMG